MTKDRPAPRRSYSECLVLTAFDAADEVAERHEVALQDYHDDNVPDVLETGDYRGEHAIRRILGQEFDAAGVEVTRWVNLYDANGKIVASSSAALDGALRAMLTRYDEHGKMTGTIDIRSDGSAVGFGEVLTKRYDT